MKTNLLRLGGLSALLSGLLALGLTWPFAADYFLAFPGYGTPPPWIGAAPAVLDGVLTFATPVQVYVIYGRIFMIAYLLAAPGILALHGRQDGRLSSWGFVVLVVGLLTTTLGVAGDYWADGAGFFVELLGLLILLAGPGCTARPRCASELFRAGRPVCWPWLDLLGWRACC